MKVITIGRMNGNDVIVNDDKVSRHHLQIVQFDDGSFHLIDFNSTNGTYVNGNRVPGEVVLDKEDFVRIGDTMLPWTTYFEPDFVSQAQEGAEETAAITKENKDKDPGQNLQPSGNNAFAILGLIFAFIMPLLGLIFSIIGLIKSKKLGGKGKGPAIAGLIISVLIIVAVIVIYVVVIAGAVSLFS